MMHISACPALLLNADFAPLSYYPLSTLAWQDAINAVIEERVSVVSEYDEVVRSPSTTMRLPSVIALRSYQKPPARVAFTRFNVFLRDGFRCQYCGAKFDSSDLTFDHVVPRCHGGITEWANVVAACGVCNTRKDRFLEMKPIKAPIMPTSHQLMAEKRKYPPKFLHESWKDLLYWDCELDPS